MSWLEMIWDIISEFVWSWMSKEDSEEKKKKRKDKHLRF
jgi:hypothetical protein